MLVDLTLRHWMLLLTTWLLLRISETVRKIVKALEPPVSAAALLGLRSSRKKSAAPTYKAGFSLPRVAQRTPSTVHSWEALHASRFQVRGSTTWSVGQRRERSTPAPTRLARWWRWTRSRRRRRSGTSSSSTTSSCSAHTRCARAPDCCALGIVTTRPTHTRLAGWNESYPEFLVINQMLPMQMGPMTTNEQTDGETLNLLTYVRLRPGLARGYDPAKDPQNAEELLKRFILRAASNPKVAVCFKEIGIILNLDEVERNGANKMLVGLIRKYNGKPVLTRPEHYFHIDPQRRYMAVDLDGHRYKYLDADRRRHGHWRRRGHGPRVRVRDRGQADCRAARGDGVLLPYHQAPLGKGEELPAWRELSPVSVSSN